MICTPSGAEVYTDRVSAALDEHDLHTEGSICLHTERSQYAHRAEPR
jgi:hypothetical protein